MKTVKAILFVLFLSLLAAPVALAGPLRIDPTLAQTNFTKQVYPYLRQNCALCHSENSVAPVGPQHSQSDPEMAFKVFQRYVDWFNADSSRIVKMVKSKHFCEDYGKECKQEDKIATDFPKLLTDYVKDVKAGSLVAPGSENLLSGTWDHSWSTEEEIVPDFTDTVTVNFIVADIPNFENPTVRSRARFSLLLKKLAGDYARVEKLSLVAPSEPVIELEGVRILINGEVPEKATGLEKLHRVFYFAPQSKSEEVSSAHPYLKVKANDKLSISFAVLRTLSQFPAVLCRDLEGFKHFVSQDYQSRLYIALNREEGVNGDPLQNCYQDESRIDLTHPSRSVLLDLLHEAYPSESDAGPVVKFIEDWVATQPAPKITADAPAIFTAKCIDCHNGNGDPGAPFIDFLAKGFGRVLRDNHSHLSNEMCRRLSLSEFESDHMPKTGDISPAEVHALISYIQKLDPLAACAEN